MILLSIILPSKRLTWALVTYVMNVALKSAILFAPISLFFCWYRFFDFKFVTTVVVRSCLTRISKRFALPVTGIGADQIEAKLSGQHCPNPVPVQLLSGFSENLCLVSVCAAERGQDNAVRIFCRYPFNFESRYTLSP